MSINALFAPSTYSAIMNPEFNTLNILTNQTIQGDLSVSGNLSSSSVTFSSAIIQSDNNADISNQLIVEGETNNLQQLDIGYNTIQDYGSIVAQNNGIIKPLKLNITLDSGGGNVECGPIFSDSISGFTTNANLSIGDIYFNGNIISPVSDGNLTLKSTGIGYLVQIQDLSILNDTISTLSSNANLILSPNGSGIVKSTANIDLPDFLAFTFAGNEGLDMNSLYLDNNGVNYYQITGSITATQTNVQLLQNKSGTISLAPFVFISNYIMEGFTVNSGIGNTYVDGLIFPGLQKFNIVDIIVNYSSSAGSTTVISIYDYTNSQTIASVSAPSTGGVFVLINLGTLNNLPLLPSIWQISFNVTGGINATYAGVLCEGN